MDESTISMSKMTIFTRNIQIWYWWLLFVFIQNVRSNSTPAQFMSYCNQTLSISSSSLSIIFTPPLSSSSSSCCNVTFIKSSLSDSSEQILLNIINMSTRNNPPIFRVFNTQMQPIKLINYISSISNRTYIKTDPIPPSVVFSLCQFNIDPFEILISNISKGPCKSNQFRCSTTDDPWCIDENFHCDGFHSCPQGIDELMCAKSTMIPRSIVMRTIRGGLVTTIIVFGLLLIIGSVIMALGFVYLRRKRQRRRQFTYSLESTSDDWEPSGTGYHMFDNWTNNRRSTTNANNDDNIASDSNEHMPITTTVTNR